MSEGLITIICCLITGICGMLGAGGVLKLWFEKKDAKHNEELKKIIREENSPIKEKIDKIDTELGAIKASFEEHKKQDQEYRMDSLRSKLLRFRDELMDDRQTNPSRERFDMAMKETDIYEDYCENHPEYENSLANESIRIIREEHMKMMKGER